ncbi:nucleoid-associated protein [Marinobacter nauticus]|uniref:nucleoid-associated protein n=1 Tax=Marinobacter nauticus TaxID=2743 RepID=UPI0040450B5D
MNGITINKVIIHGFNKDKNGPVEDPDWGSILDTTNKGVVRLLEAILDAYGKKHNRVQYGTFCEPSRRGKFADHFMSYYELHSIEDQNFEDLSTTAINELMRTAHSASAATGGYIVFYDYLRDGVRFFMVAMVKQRPGLRITEKMVPELVTEVETNKLHQAARINFQKFSEYNSATDEEKQEISYLNFLSPAASAGASTYFILALDCIPGVATSRATTAVIREAFAIYSDNGKLKHHAHDMRAEMVSFLKDKAENQQPVNLHEVSAIFQKHLPLSVSDEAEEITQKYIDTLNDESNAVPFQFNVNKTSTNAFSQVTAKTKAWSFNVEYSVLGDEPGATVYYNRKTGSLTFTELPDDVKQKIINDLDARQQ